LTTIIYLLTDSVTDCPCAWDLH